MPEMLLAKLVKKEKLNSDIFKFSVECYENFKRNS